MCIYEYEEKSFQELLSSKSQVLDFPGLYTSTAEGTGSIPGQGTQVPPATQLRQNKGKKKKRKKNPCFSQCSEEEKKIRGNEAKSVDIHE